MGEHHDQSNRPRGTAWMHLGLAQAKGAHVACSVCKRRFATLRGVQRHERECHDLDSVSGVERPAYRVTTGMQPPMERK